MTIIDWINQVLIYKKPWDYFSDSDKKTFNTFIINRWLSMDKEFIEFVNYFQEYSIGTLESREVYRWYCDVLPRGKRFNKYIKSLNIKNNLSWCTQQASSWITHNESYKTFILTNKRLIKKYEDMMEAFENDFPKYLEMKGIK